MAWNGPVDSVHGGSGGGGVQGGLEVDGKAEDGFAKCFLLFSTPLALLPPSLLSNSVYPCLDARVFCAF